VIASLSVVGEEGERSASALGERIDEAFRAAGLAGEVVLSPAQRRAAGVVARRGHFAASYTCLGGGVGGSHNRRGVAALVAVWSLQGSPTLEETRVAVPEGFGVVRQGRELPKTGWDNPSATTGGGRWGKSQPLPQSLGAVTSLCRPAMAGSWDSNRADASISGPAAAQPSPRGPLWASPWATARQ
jgi:hypothetical protein